MTILLALTEWDEEPWIEQLWLQFQDRKTATKTHGFSADDVRYAVVWKHPPGLLAQLPNLQAIFSLGAGVEHVLCDPDLPSCPLIRTVDTDLTDRMSEYVVLHCLSHLRQVDRYRKQQNLRQWKDDPSQAAAREVRVGVMGLGVLGIDSCQKLSQMGFDVAGWSRTEKAIAGIETFSGERFLDPFLARTDILVVLLPSTPQTRGILCFDLFSKLASDGSLGGPILINVGRGDLQNEADLIKALDMGVLLGVTLDVFEEEPLPKTSRLWAHPRVVLTPHNAAMTSPEAVVRYIRHQVGKIERGEPPQNVVDPALGY